MGLFKKLEGTHVTVPEVPTEILAEPPTQILVSGEMDMELSKTWRVTGTVTEPQLSEITTVKVVVTLIVAVGLEIVGLSNKLAGVQL